MVEKVFTAGWEWNVLIYGSIFLLAEYAVYKIIFRSLIGAPTSYQYEDQRYWHRKASFIGAVIFAPLYEEIMFTYLAYASFLDCARPGKEGAVILFVAVFFALLHLPGDLRRIRYDLRGSNLLYLFKYQLQRFFYMLAAYFIYQSTGQLWVTILLHYFFNAIVSFYNFDLEDATSSLGQGDGRLLLIILLNIGFTLLAGYFFYEAFPHLGIYLLPLVGLTLFDAVKTGFRWKEAI